ncbi:hypothetical protein [Agrobacterium tumefaciens]|uniref:Uncharacterized protein n=1 Tax=Agrobacterium tumefaciens TaxID=358 RepID=A0A4D7YM98_AGRTU|nr:hypothetical protein [Agrobacterium tumefaciens]QCL98311.1 hypothetical protein CFBP7129_29620 [Agrobacterium tumefaciens]
MGHTNWSTLIRQIKKHRSESAQFFKPVCVIAAIDLADEGQIEPTEIEGKAICDRFSDYVTPFHPDRGKDGYKPFWHLTNDRLWTFFHDDKPLVSSDFSHGAPASKAKLFAKTDRIAINEDYIDLWKSKTERQILRQYMLAILNESDTDSRVLIPPLFEKANLLKRELWPDEGQLRAFFSNLTGQSDLFDVVSSQTLTATADPEPNASTQKAAEPEALEHVPTAIAYGWVKDKIAVVSKPADWPVFPYATSHHNHGARLEACRELSLDLISKLNRQAWQVRVDYLEQLEFYLKWLPTADKHGNILLADGAARAIRHMFSAEREALPLAFAASLRTFLENHIALRAFYPEIEEYYRSVRSGHVEAPLPLDAVSDVIGVIEEQTPALFDHSVSDAVKDATLAEPQVVEIEGEATKSVISPPIDPLGELDLTKAHDFQTAGWVNNLWKIFIAGPTAHASLEAWNKTYHALVTPVTAILKWLREFIS